MDYSFHYQTLISRARDRSISGYGERHHVLPRCMGGTNDADNLVTLTGREHYIAHQLLVKMYPNNYALIRAANMMCSSNQLQSDRSQNRLYEWLRIKLVDVLKQQTGEKNSQYGTIWIYSPELEIDKKIPKELIEQYLNQGWLVGRRTRSKQKYCKGCNDPISYERNLTNSRYCTTECNKEYRSNTIGSNGRMPALHSRDEELLEKYKELGSLNKALKAMGFPGAIGAWYKQAKKILDNHKKSDIIIL